MEQQTGAQRNKDRTEETEIAKNQPSVSPLTYLVVIFLILGIGIWVYRNSLRAPFLFDDYFTIARNFPLRDLSRIGETVRQNLFAAAGQATSAYFRPLTQLTFALDYQLWGLTPAGYRLTNITLHLINAVLVFLLVQRWFSLGAASLVSLLFVVHPVNLQAIVYISSRSDPLFFFFSVLTVYLWMTDKTTLRPFCLLSFLLAIFSKEPAVVTPALVLLADLARSQSLAEAKGTLSRTWPWYLGFALVFLLYLAIRVWFLSYPLLMEKGGGFLTAGERLPLASKLLGNYLLLLYFPVNLAFEHTVSPTKGILDGEVIAPVLVIILMGYLGAKLWHRDKAILLGLGWFLIGISPVLNLTLLNLPMMESWLYLPEIGLLLMTVALGRMIPAGKGLRVVVSCLVVLLLSMRTVVRGADWGDPIRLFEKNVSLYPNAYLAWSGLSEAYRLAGRKNDSFEALKKAENLRPRRWTVHLSLALYYFNNNDDDKARKEMLTALRLKPDSAWAYYFLGILNFRSGQWPEALEAFKKALSGRPHIPMLYHVIGSTQLALGKNKAAEGAFHRALQDSPSHRQYHGGIHIELGRLLKKRGDMQGAKREFELALRFHPESRLAKEELASLQKEGR
ncbi:MAG: tetratricopeptide repeat protein [Candidatus Binatia bacterium]